MEKPRMIITGAAGYLGRRLLAAFQPGYEIFALDCRPPEATGAPQGDGIHWLQVDVGNEEAVRQGFDAIRQQPIDFLLHLAGYYDFTGDDHPEYQRSNVEGTRNVLEMAAWLDLKRLIFASSIAACPFPPQGQAVNEDTPADGVEPYSRSKRAGEDLIRERADRIPATIVRLAAVFTDWCEYDPLTNFLETWCSSRWDARILGGRGDWAIPYIHIDDLVAFFTRVVAQAEAGQPLDVLLGSPSACTSQRELYIEATQAYYGSPRWAIPMPKPLARAGIAMREVLARTNGHMPFERSWMGNYIDQQLAVDASLTHRRLGWEPTPELDILRRVPVMVQNFREHPDEWKRRHQVRQSTRMRSIRPDEKHPTG